MACGVNTKKLMPDILGSHSGLIFTAETTTPPWVFLNRSKSESPASTSMTFLNVSTLFNISLVISALSLSEMPSDLFCGHGLMLSVQADIIAEHSTPTTINGNLSLRSRLVPICLLSFGCMTDGKEPDDNKALRGLCKPTRIQAAPHVRFSVRFRSLKERSETSPQPALRRLLY